MSGDTPIAHFRDEIARAQDRGQWFTMNIPAFDLVIILDAADAMARLLESIDEGANLVARWRALGGLS